MAASCLQFAHIINIAYHVIPSSEYLHLPLLTNDGINKNKDRKVQIGNYQEMAQSEKKFQLHKPRAGKKTKMTLRYLYQENI